MLQAVVEAIAIFAVTNVDDLLLLALYFGRARGDRHAERAIVAGQYLGFGAIVTVSVLATLGLSVLSSGVLAYLGLVPLGLGIRAAVIAWRTREAGVEGGERFAPLGVGAVAGVTLANGGDNVGVYVPVFTAISRAELAAYGIVFVALVAVWCLAGRYLATRSPVAKALSRWGHVVLPVVLIAIGVVILVDGGAFGL
jgi:cadmium resistance protein CadD (predicted permease)